MKVGASTMISPSMPAPSLWLSPAPSTPSRRAGGAAGATIRPGGAKLGFWLGLCVGLLSVMALLATSEHQVADGGKKRGSGSGTSRRGTSSVSGNPPPQHEGTALRATLRKESLQDAPSCVHTFGQLELMNAHPTDPIVIHSIRTTKERTVPVLGTIKADEGGGDGVVGRHAADSPGSYRISYECWEDGGSLLPGSGGHEHDDHAAEIGEIWMGEDEAPAHDERGLFSSSAQRDKPGSAHGKASESDAAASHSPANASTSGSNATNHSETGTLMAGPGLRSPSAPSKWRLPRQIQANNFPTASFVLGANQIAIVPISFLPRFPPLGPRAARPAEEDPVYVPSLAQRRDLERWLGPKRRSNRFVGTRGGAADAGGEPASKDRRRRPGDSQTYRVSATLVIETSVGVLELPLEATSHRRNDYGLPDRITFPPEIQPPTASARSAATPASSSPSPSSGQREAPKDAVQASEESGSERSPVVVAVHSTRRTNLPTAVPRSTREGDGAPRSQLEPAADGCYDLHIRNPASPSSSASALPTLSHHHEPAYEGGGPFAVLAVTVSMPDRVAIHFSASSPPASSPSHSAEKSKLLNDAREDGSAPTGGWQARDEYGGFVGGSEGIIVPADGRAHYVATLCPRYDGPGKMAPSSGRSATPLPGAAGTSGGGYSLGGEDAGSEGAALLVSPTQEETWLGFAHVLTSHDSLFVSLERQPERSIEVRSGGQHEGSNATGAADLEANASRTTGAEPVSSRRKSDLESHLSVLPASIDAQLVSSAGPHVRIPIQLRYSGSAAASSVAIMRASVVYEVSSELRGLDFTLSVAGQGLNGSSWIQANETMKDGLVVECAVDWDKFAFLSPQQPVTIEGALIIRSSSSGSYEEWEEVMKIDPSLDAHLVAEIPLRVKLIKGEVGLIIQSTSHPDGIFWSYRPWGEALAVSAAFFPACQDGVRASLSVHEDSDFYQLPAMTHQLRVFSNVEAATRVRKAQIVAAKELTPSSSLMPSNSLCRYFEVSVKKDRDDRYEGIVNSTDLGLIELTYRFPESSMSSTENQSSNFPVTCYLKLTTEPDTGSHFMPLVMYTGHVDLSVSQLGRDASSRTGNQDIPVDEDESTMWHRTVIGFDRVLTWLLSTKAGASFRAVLSLTAKKTDTDRTLLERFISGISPPLVNNKVKPLLRPVLVQAGALAHGEIERLPLYMTNTNPVPIEVWIDVGEVEGMSLALGRDQSTGRGDGNSILDYLPEPPHVHLADRSTWASQPRVTSGAFSGHPINGLRQFLLSDDFATSFFAQFPYRAAISLSSAATARLPILQDLFMTFSLGEFYRHQLPFRFFPGSWSRCDNSVHPPHYGSFDRKPVGGKPIGPVIVSNDGRSARELPVCWDRNGEPDIKRRSEDTSIHLPPGATARFDVTLRAPSQLVLEKDITQFLTTGLVLSTNHGEVMPIFVSFEALQGRFDVSHVPSSHISESTPREGVISVPMKLFGQRSHENASVYLTIPPKPSRHSSMFASGEIVRRNVTTDRNGVTLYMRSTFTREVRLRKVLSCNPWFQFERTNASEPRIDPIRGIEIGVVTSAVPCDTPSELSRNKTWNPSYFCCLLNWLENRTDLQPNGCGTVPTKDNSPRNKDSTRMSETAGIDRAVRSLKRALVVSHYAHGPFNAPLLTYDASEASKSGDRTSDGVVSSLLIDVMAEAWDAWRTISAHGLNSMSTSMRAVIDYNSTEGDALPTITQVLSVALRNLTIESAFHTPRILDVTMANRRRLSAISGTDTSPSVIEFPATTIAGASYISIPLRNPTSVPVKVRLSVLPTRENSPGPFNSVLKVEKSVKSRFLQGIAPPYVQNAKTTGANQDDLRNDWWDDSAGYFMPDFDGDIICSKHNVTIIAGPHAVVSLYNPSLLASTSFLLGCGPRCSVKDDASPGQPLHTATFGAGAALGSTIVSPNRWAKPNERRHTSMSAGSLSFAGSSAFAIPYSSLDEVVIPPHGEAEIGPVVFRPPGRSSKIGCRALADSGTSSDCATGAFQAMLFLENSLTGLERVVLKGQGKIQRIDFIDPIPTEGYETFGDIELRHGFPTLVFPGSGIGKEPVVKEAVMLNSGDVPVNVRSASLVGTSSTKSVSTGTRDEESACEFGAFFLRDCTELNRGFTLGPGQNRSVVVELYQECRFRKDVASLSFELGRGPFPTHSTDQILKPGRSRYSGTNSVPNSEGREKVELRLLYEMSKGDFASCRPVGRPTSVEPGFDERESMNTSVWTLTQAARVARRSKPPIARGAVLFSVYFCAVVLSRWLLLRKHSSLSFHASLTATKSGRLAAPGSSWLTSFRILARVDPSPQDLQNVGREQARHLLLPRYRSYGGHMPHCISATGSFQRDKLRPGGPNNGNKEGGAERTKTLSDALFRHYVPPEDGLGRLPCELGWRIAYMRGLINNGSLSASPVVSRTTVLIIRREQEPTVDDAQGSEESSDEALGSSDDESVDSETSTDFSEIVVPDLGSFAKPQRRSSGAKAADAAGTHANGDGSGHSRHAAIRLSVPIEDESIHKSSPTSQMPNTASGATASESISKQRGRDLQVPPLPVDPSEEPFSKARPTSESRRKRRGNDAAGPGQSRGKAKPTDASAAGASSPRVESTGKVARERKARQIAGQATADNAVPAVPGPSRSSSTGAATSKRIASSTPRKNAWRSKITDVPREGSAVTASPIRPPPGLPPPPGFGAPVASLFPQAAAGAVGTSKQGSHSPVIERPRYTVARKASNDSIDAVSSGHSPLLAPPVLNLSASLSGLNHPPPIPESFSLYDDATAAPGPLPTPEQPPQVTPLSATQGFDIMDFLDGVLNEAGSSGVEGSPPGASSSWEDDLLNEGGPPSSMTIESLLMGLEGRREGTNAAMIVDEDDSNNNSFSGAIPLVSANPWASDEPPTIPLDNRVPATATTRLSTLYGISIEDVSDRGAGGHEDAGGDGDDGDLLVDLFPAMGEMATLVEGETGDDDDGNDRGDPAAGTGRPFRGPTEG